MLVGTRLALEQKAVAANRAEASPYDICARGQSPLQRRLRPPTTSPLLGGGLRVATAVESFATSARSWRDPQLVPQKVIGHGGSELVLSLLSFSVFVGVQQELDLLEPLSSLDRLPRRLAVEHG